MKVMGGARAKDKRRDFLYANKFLYGMQIKGLVRRKDESVPSRLRLGKQRSANR